MNLVTTCPDIPDTWKGGISQASRILGLDRKTLSKYASLGKRRGGIDWNMAANGRKVFLGKEIKRFWHIL